MGVRLPWAPDSNHALVDTIHLESLSLRNYVVDLYSMRSVSEAAGRFQAGLLGEDFLQHFTVEIDYRERVVRLYDPARYAYAGPGVLLPFMARNASPVIRSPIALHGRDSAKARLLLDTGNGSLCLILFTPFVDRRKLATVLNPTIEGPLITGLAGPLRVAVGSVPALRLGSLAFASVPTGLGREQKSFLAITRYDGVLGGRLFREGRVILDYARHRVIVEPGAPPGHDCTYDRSGLVLRAQGPDYREFKVAFVVPRSPAADSGIQIGDQLLAVDGRATGELELPDIRRSLTADGVIRQFRIMRGADTILVTLPLRRLF
ncbi:MAG TPA: PDZ domain-containing protein [Gemmatimonadales bacterium]|nr:PDZ domain-containing protein [Gemmatimonadales bacterium]